jgi:hypothetical protein
LRANGSGERPPDDRLREAIQSHKESLDCFVPALLATTADKLEGNYFAAMAVCVASAGRLASNACSVLMVE